jgi:hypothetical protein
MKSVKNKKNNISGIDIDLKVTILKFYGFHEYSPEQHVADWIGQHEEKIIDILLNNESVRELVAAKKISETAALIKSIIDEEDDKFKAGYDTYRPAI